MLPFLQGIVCFGCIVVSLDSSFKIAPLCSWVLKGNVWLPKILKPVVILVVTLGGKIEKLCQEPIKIGESKILRLGISS